MSIHIGAAPGDIAETVLMPGDPLRAKWAADRFLSGVRCVNRVRGMLGFTGTWQDHPVTIQGSGMGMASLAIYATELIRDYGVRTVIRTGTCGAMQAHLALGETVLAMTASHRAMPSQGQLGAMHFAPAADWGLLRAAEAEAAARGIRAHVGGIYSSDSFHDDDAAGTEALARHGCLAVEMETAELYTIAARHGVRALSVLAVSDQLGTGDRMSAEARETGLEAVFGIALAAAFA